MPPNSEVHKCPSTKPNISFIWTWAHYYAPFDHVHQKTTHVAEFVKVGHVGKIIKPKKILLKDKENLLISNFQNVNFFLASKLVFNRFQAVSRDLTDYVILINKQLQSTFPLSWSLESFIRPNLGHKNAKMICTLMSFSSNVHVGQQKRLKNTGYKEVYHRLLANYQKICTNFM